MSYLQGHPNVDICLLGTEYAILKFGDFSTSLWKPFVNHLRKLNEYVKETQRHPNVDISHLGAKMTNLKFLEIFQD